MFRKPKRKAKASLRRKDEEQEEDDSSKRGTAFAAAENDNNDDDDDETQELLSEARKRSKMTSAAAGGASIQSKSTSTTNNPSSSGSLLQTYKSSSTTTAADLASKNAALATSTAEHHPESKQQQQQKQQVDNNNMKAQKGADGIFRDATRNKFLAGPIRAAQHVRVTARFDYQPDICKDYKDTGFCGFGDTCIYLHDRSGGDATLTGWQLEQQWEQEQKEKKAKQEQELQDFVDQQLQLQQGTTPSSTTTTTTTTTEDGLPFACHMCREYFKEPVVTTCHHYFCEACILNHVKTVSESCPICGKDTYGVFHQPTKLLAKKRRVLGAAAAKAEDSWEQFAKSFVAVAQQTQNDSDS